MLKGVYALVGTDLFRQLQVLGELAAELGPDIHRVDLEGETAELAQVLDEVRTFTLFGGGKLVVVRNADKFISAHRQALETFIQNRGSDTSTVLVLRVDSLPATQRIYKLIAKVGQVVKCEPPADLERWAIQQARSAHQVTLKPAAARLLVDLVGSDLGRLDNELAKLALASNDGTIDERAISGAVAFQRDMEIKEMTREVAIGRPELAVARWRQLMQTDPTAEYRAVTWLCMWLEDVRQVLTNASGAMRQIAWRYQPDDGKMRQEALRLGTGGLARVVQYLCEVDYQSKTGVGDMAGNVERFLLTLAAERAGV
jgi:DNA polymerase III delta subunit